MSLSPIRESVDPTGPQARWHVAGSLPLQGNLRRIWPVALASLALLGAFRALTEAEFALASAAIIPVYLVAWAGGFFQGMVVAILAALMWLMSELWSAPARGDHWIVALNGATHFLVYLLVAYLTSRVRALLLHEAEIARREPLTGLFNRRAFYEIGHQEVSRASRYQHPIAIVFIDLDRFKQLNDSSGHEAGDRALCAVAQALTGALRCTDVLARLGGDEFAIILPEVDRRGTRATGDKLVAEIDVALQGFAPVSASIGIAWFERAGSDFNSLLKEADSLMYTIKRERVGGLRLQYFSSSPSGASVNGLSV